MLGKTVANKYRITAQLGCGGMGCVYRAEHLMLGRESALKVLHTQFNNETVFLERFMREARAMARLDHDNIVRIYDVFKEENAYYIAMELFEGPTLKSVIEHHGRIPYEQSVLFIGQCARGLSYAHAQGIVHRDIKPSNIMINNRGRIKITDFGIAAAMNDVSSSLTSTGQLMGTPRYMSPEQAKTQKVDKRSDLYSLGMVFYELVTGHTPFEGDSGITIVGKLAHDTNEIDLEFHADTPGDIQNLIRKMLRRNPDERIPDANHLIVELHKLSTKPVKPDSTITSILNVLQDELSTDIKTHRLEKTVALEHAYNNHTAEESPQSEPVYEATPPDGPDKIETVGRKNAGGTAKAFRVVFGVAVLLLVSLLVGKFYIKSNGNGEKQIATAETDSGALDLSIQVKKDFNDLVEMQLAARKSKNQALDVNAEKYARREFSDANEKLAAVDTLVAGIEKAILAQDFTRAKLSIEKVKQDIATVSRLFQQASKHAEKEKTRLLAQAKGHGTNKNTVVKTTQPGGVDSGRGVAVKSPPRTTPKTTVATAPVDKTAQAPVRSPCAGEAQANVSCIELGDKYSRRGTAFDFSKAVSFYRKSCIEVNNMQGCGKLANLYLSELGGWDANKALPWLEKACDFDQDSLACEQRDQIRRINNNERLCANRKYDSCYFLATVYGTDFSVNASERNTFAAKHRKYVRPDDARSFALYQISCEQGKHPEACFSLAGSYRIGRGVGKDYGKAFKIYEDYCRGDAIVQSSSSNSNDAKDMLSCYYLGVMYQKGLGVDKDIDKAIDLYLTACQDNKGPRIACTAVFKATRGNARGVN